MGRQAEKHPDTVMHFDRSGPTAYDGKGHPEAKVIVQPTDDNQEKYWHLLPKELHVRPGTLARMSTSPTSSFARSWKTGIPKSMFGKRWLTPCPASWRTSRRSLTANRRRSKTTVSGRDDRLARGGGWFFFVSGQAVADPSLALWASMRR